MIDLTARIMRTGGARLLGAIALTCVFSAFFVPGASAFRVTSFSAQFRATQPSENAPPPAAPTQAGSHPYSAGAAFEFESTDESQRENSLAGVTSVGDVKNIDVELPVGLIGDPSAVPTCDPDLITILGCPAASQIGVTHVLALGIKNEEPLYNLTPPPGVPAEFGFYALGFVPVFITASVRPAEPGGTEGYGLDLHIHEISQATSVLAAGIEFFGNPAGAAGKKPFLTMPTSCGGRLTLRSQVSPWEGGVTLRPSAYVSDQQGSPVTVSGCERVPFEPRVSTSLDNPSADSPSGLELDVETPQQTSPEGIAPANLRTVTVALPEGFSVDPSAAAGLTGCSLAQFDQFSEAPSRCPDSSKIGSVEIDAPLLRDPLLGGVYLARQDENPFNSLIALYLVAEADGVRIKLPGKVTLDPTTGRPTATFDEAPQLPFEELKIHLFDGPRAALATPVRCGTRTAESTLSPWSRRPPTILDSSLGISAGAGGSPCPGAGSRPFGIGFEASTVSPAAALHSPFDIEFSRPDGSQEMGSIEAHLPEGLLASIKGVPRCPASAAAAGTCGSASQVGSIVVGAGAGPAPYYVKNGQAYLTGPYGDAPLGLDFVVPAVAGPLNLGTVNVRAALFVDPVTTAVTVRSDPLPTILQGIPLRLRSVAIGVDRPGFILNPTSCDPTRVTGQVGGSEGTSANLSDRFQAAGCRGLGFEPKLKLALKGGTRRNGHPALTAMLTQPPGQANIDRVSVALPRSEFLEQNHIRTVCTRVQFAADACPKGSVYGTAEVVTPLLDSPLRGPVYLRSSSHTLPDLVAVLKGSAEEPIEIDLSGRIDSVRGAIRTTFEGIPDAPLSKFTLRLRGGRRSLIVNSTDVCRSAGKATVKMTGQNGALHDVKAPLQAKCGVGKTGGGKRR